MSQPVYFGGIIIPQLSCWLSVIIFVSCVVLTAYFLESIRPVNAALKRAIEKIRALNGTIRAKDLSDLNKFFESEPLLAAAWREFSECLEAPDADTFPDVPVVNASQAEHFINYRTIVEHKLNLDLCTAGPGMFTALGLLGTFLSIFVALSLLKLAHGDVAEIEPFVNNLSGKFICSIVGLSAGFFFQVIEKCLLGQVNTLCICLQNELNGALKQNAGSNTFVEILSSIDQLKQSVEELKTKLPDHLKDALSTAVSPQLTAMQDSNAELCRMTEASAKRREESITRLVTSVVQSFRDALTNSAFDDIEKLTLGLKAASQTVEQMNNSLSRSLEQFEKTIESQRVQIDNFVTVQQGKSDYWTQQQQERADQWSQQQQDQWQQFSKAYQSQLNLLTQGQADQLEAQTKGINTACDELLRSFEKSSTNYQHKVNASVEKLLLQFETSIETQQKEVKTLVDYILGGVDGWASSASKQLETVLNASGKTTTQINQVSKNLESSLATFSQAIADLERISKSSSKGADSLELLAVQMEKSLDPMTDALKAAREAMLEFASQTSAQQTLLSSQEKLWLKMQELSNAVEEKATVEVR